MCHHIESPFWFLWEMLFFVISLFGIFNAPCNRSGFCLDFNATVLLNENTDLALKWCKRKDKGPAFLLPKDRSNITISNNRMYINKKLRKRYGIVLAFQLLAWVAIVIVLFVWFITSQQ